nr:uncharacterized protein LOC105861721 isoform X2 [Microcebus murinus]
MAGHTTAVPFQPPQAPGMPDRLTELEPQISSLPHCRRWWWRQSLRRLTHDQWKGIHFSFFLQRGILNWIQMFFDAEAKRPQYPAFCFPGGYWLLLAMKPKLEPLNELKLWSVGAEEQGHGTAGVMAFQELSKMERRALCSFQLQEPEQGERAAVSQPEILDQPYQLVEGEAFCTSPGPLIRSSNISGLLGWKKSWQRESPQVQISKWASLFEGFIDSWGKHGCRHISLGRNLMEECANTVTANKKRCAQLWLGTGRGQEVCQKKSLWTFLGFWLGLAYQ